MRNRYLLIALAAALLAGGVWLFASDGARARGARPRAVAGSDATSPISTTAPLEGSERADVELASTAVDLTTQLAPTTEPSARPADIEGTLLLERADGARELAADGSFTLIAWKGDVGKPVKVDVHAGRWAARFPDEIANTVARVGFQNVRLGERSAVIREPSGAVVIPSDHFIAIVVSLPATTILRVVDANTGRDLDDVELCGTAGWPNAGDFHPGPDAGRGLLAQHQASPIDFGVLNGDRELGIRILRVHAPGYAWNRITLDTRAGCECVLQLQRGGALRLTLVDNSASKAVQLRFRRVPEETAQVLSMPCEGSGEVLFDGLEAGAYSISAEIGKSNHEPIGLGRVDVVIVAGIETRATLEIEAAPRVELATADGVVIVPPQWGSERLILTLRLLDTPLDGRGTDFEIDAERAATQADGRLTFPWTQRDLQVGRYELRVYGPPASFVFDVPRAGKTDFRFELAPPAELAVRVVDDITGDEVDVERLLWSPRVPEGAHGSSTSAEFDIATRRFLIRAPVGEIDLHAMGGESGSKWEVVTLTPGRHEHTVRVRRNTSIDVVLLDGGIVLPPPEGWYASIETEDGKPVRYGGSTSTTLRRYSLPSAGRYRFKLPPINGYQPIPAQMVDAEEGKTMRLEIALTKAL